MKGSQGKELRVWGDITLPYHSVPYLLKGENIREGFPDFSFHPFWSPSTIRREYSGSILAAATTRLIIIIIIIMIIIIICLFIYQAVIPLNGASQNKAHHGSWRHHSPLP